MHIHTLEQWQHSHNFSSNQEQAEKTTKIVMVLTAVTMAIEIVAGSLFGSMALLADGWHMATHVAAFGITVFAYQYARTHASDPKYTFGTGKVSILGGFTSAVVLAVIAFVMALESVARFFQPHVIQFNEAIGVAVIGLIVNLISALLLQDHHHDHHHQSHPDQHPNSQHNSDHSHQHNQNHDQHHDHEHYQTDHNLRAAYLHVLADALTSVFAIVALFAGKFLGWVWLDAVMGLVGAVVIAKWAYSLVRETGSILLDGAIDPQTTLTIINAIEQDADNRVTDLHIWHVSPNHLAGTIAIVTHYPQAPDYYKQLLSHISTLSHVVVEVNPCHGESCLELQPKVGSIN